MAVTSKRALLNIECSSDGLIFDQKVAGRQPGTPNQYAQHRLTLESNGTVGFRWKDVSQTCRFFRWAAAKKSKTKAQRWEIRLRVTHAHL